MKASELINYMKRHAHRDTEIELVEYHGVPSFVNNTTITDFDLEVLAQGDVLQIQFKTPRIEEMEKREAELAEEINDLENAVKALRSDWF